MASILDRYGIREVADVTFYNIKDDGTRGDPVLYLDTLKVSTIEQTAETADARGGKGNPKLITWDYGKDITVTLEDALFSAKSLSIMFGDGTVTPNAADTITKTTMARIKGEKIEYFMADVLENGGAVRKKVYFGTAGADGVAFVSANPTIAITKVVDENGKEITLTTTDGKVVAKDEGANVNDKNKVFITYSFKANSKTISVSADTFPGTYYVAGDTYARSDVTGEDQFFQFIIQKAKVTSENTITLEAEGDPSVFNMNLTVLRPEDGEMMKLVQYDLVANAQS